MKRIGTLSNKIRLTRKILAVSGGLPLAVLFCLFASGGGSGSTGPDPTCVETGKVGDKTGKQGQGVLRNPSGYRSQGSPHDADRRKQGKSAPTLCLWRRTSSQDAGVEKRQECRSQGVEEGGPGPSCLFERRKRSPGDPCAYSSLSREQTPPGPMIREAFPVRRLFLHAPIRRVRAAWSGKKSRQREPRSRQRP